MSVKSRQLKTATTRPELEDAWATTAARNGLLRDDVAALRDDEHVPTARTRPWADRVEEALSQERAIFTGREARAVALEQGAGHLRPDAALAGLAGLKGDGRLIELEDGRLTTARLRDMEERLVAQTAAMAATRDRSVSMTSLREGIEATQERIGASLSPEQRAAVETLTGLERVAALIGPAGTGKGVVIDAVARAHQADGRDVIGVAVAGATAQRLGTDSSSLTDRTMTIDALTARADRRYRLSPSSVVICDEAGMVDTQRLSRLVDLVERSEARLLLVGDGRQLPAIGPGGMFDHLAEKVPCAELTDVRRTPDPEEQAAWRALRAGEPEPTLAHLLDRGRLHIADERDQALEHAVQQYDRLAAKHGHDQVALMTDGPTQEVDRLNARAQNLRSRRAELGTQEIDIPDGPSYGLRFGDRVAWTAIQTIRDDRRIENGTRGRITSCDFRTTAVTVELDSSGREVTVQGPDLAKLRLGYAQHTYRQQGATVEHAVVLTGGWQTGRESGYVQASRARQRTDFHVSRDDLGSEGTDVDRVQRLADALKTTRAHPPSVTVARRVPSVNEEHLLASQPPTRTLERDLPTPDTGMGMDL